MELDANHDALTGLFDRKAAEQYVAQRIDDVATVALGGFALMLIALDAPNNINAVLKEASQRMTQLLRESDYLARWEGAAFLVLIPQISDRETLETIAQKVFDKVGASYGLERVTLSVTLNIGISTFPRDGADCETLIRRANRALDEAKGRGPNLVRFHARESDNAA